MNPFLPAAVVVAAVIVASGLALNAAPPAPEPPPSFELTPETCAAGGGQWTECGSPCVGTDAEVCITVCEAQCQCGGFAGWTCPQGYTCRLTGRIADELGKCIPTRK